MHDPIDIYNLVFRYTEQSIRVIFAATMSSVVNSVCCALVCVLCVSLVVWTITVTSAVAEEAGAGHQQRPSTSESVLCAINSSLEINRVGNVEISITLVLIFVGFVSFGERKSKC